MLFVMLLQILQRGDAARAEGNKLILICAGEKLAGALAAAVG